MKLGGGYVKRLDKLHVEGLSKRFAVGLFKSMLSKESHAVFRVWGKGSGTVLHLFRFLC